MMRLLPFAIVAGAIALAFGAIPIQFTARSVPTSPKGRVANAPSAQPPARAVNLLFIHHSVGQQLLSDPGTQGTPGQSPHGGGLRALLEGSGYRVHAATYGSNLGEHTDLFDWPAKFRDHMDALLTTADGTRSLSAGERADVVMFKSCFPNNQFVGAGVAPGNPVGPELTVENAKAALRSLLPEFQKHPEALFVFLTTPPLAPRTYPQRAALWLANLARGRSQVKTLESQAGWSRQFADWVTSPTGWLEGYPLSNVAVIDYYDMLTAHGASNLLAFPSGDGSDSHPSSDGQRASAPEIVAALNRAVARAGVVEKRNQRPASGTLEARSP